MKPVCANHPDRPALSTCHRCGGSFCSACLSEGAEYYYCQTPECQAALRAEMLPEVVACPSCGEHLELSDDERRTRKFWCPQCERSSRLEAGNIDPGSTPPGPAGDEKAPSFGGWLILAILAVLLFTVRMLVGLLNEILPAFLSRDVSYLTTPGSAFYHPMWSVLLHFTLWSSIILLGMSAVAGVLILGKKRIGPKLFAGVLVMNLLYVVIEKYIIAGLPLSAQGDGAADNLQMIMAFVGCVIWIGYFQRSKRARSTFVE